MLKTLLYHTNQRNLLFKAIQYKSHVGGNIKEKETPIMALATSKYFRALNPFRFNAAKLIINIRIMKIKPNSTESLENADILVYSPDIYLFKL